MSRESAEHRAWRRRAEAAEERAWRFREEAARLIPRDDPDLIQAEEWLAKVGIKGHVRRVRPGQAGGLEVQIEHSPGDRTCMCDNCREARAWGTCPDHEPTMAHARVCPRNTRPDADWQEARRQHLIDLAEQARTAGQVTVATETQVRVTEDTRSVAQAAGVVALWGLGLAGSIAVIGVWWTALIIWTVIFGTAVLRRAARRYNERQAEQREQTLRAIELGREEARRYGLWWVEDDGTMRIGNVHLDGEDQ